VKSLSIRTFACTHGETYETFVMLNY